VTPRRKATLGQDNSTPWRHRTQSIHHPRSAIPDPHPQHSLGATAGVRLVALEEDDVGSAQKHISMYQRLACARTHSSANQPRIVDCCRNARGGEAECSIARQQREAYWNRPALQRFSTSVQSPTALTDVSSYCTHWRTRGLYASST